MPTFRHHKHVNKRLTMKSVAFPRHTIYRPCLSPQGSKAPGGERPRPAYVRFTVQNVYATHFLHPPPTSLLDFSSTHSSLEASLFLLELHHGWITDQAVSLQTKQPPGSLIMENKQTTETAEVLLQGLKLYLASYFFFFLNKCIHVQLEAFFLSFLFFLPSAQISHILWLTGPSPDLKYTERFKIKQVCGVVVVGGGAVMRAHTFLSSKLEKHKCIEKESKILYSHV